MHRWTNAFFSCGLSIFQRSSFCLPSGASSVTGAKSPFHWVESFIRFHYSTCSSTLNAPKQFKTIPTKKPKKVPHAPSTLVSSEEAERLIKEGLAFQGQLRVLSPALACVDHPMDKRWVFIFGSNRSQALNGDIVIVRLLPMGLWKVSGTGPSQLIAQSQSSVETELRDTDSAVPETTAPEETLESEFAKVPSVDSPVEQPSPEDFYRLPSKYRHLYLYRSLDDLAFDPHCSWPVDLPWNLNLTATPMVWTPLPSPSLIRSGQVISIFKKNPRSRRLVGHVGFFLPRVGRITRKTPPLPADAPTEDAICLFVPNCTNYALVKLDPASIPKAIFENRALGTNTNYVCTITGWNKRFNLPSGVLCDQLGDMNELEPATKQILLEYGLEDREFRPEHLQGLPSHPDHFVIPAAEYVQRRDFRSRCIVTIDPPSAKDIDDALHIKKIGDDLYEVGIHIADVSYFVKPGTPLDQEAAERTTSIYLVQRVIPMLPSILSEHLCSLNPCVDRLAFSVVLKVRTSGEILDSWFGRSIIRSRAKLSYDQALAVLKAAEDTDNPEKWRALRNVVPTPEAPFTFDSLKQSLVLLNKIARNLRQKRLENGALTLQKIKIEFDLPSTTFDPNPEVQLEDRQSDDTAGSADTGSTQARRTIWPRGYSIQAAGPAHQLIEEWMLAANQAVAKRLFDEFWKCRYVTQFKQSRTVNPMLWNESSWPGVLLRRHEAPNPSDMNKLVSLLRAGGIELHEQTSKALSIALDEHSKKLKAQGCTNEEHSALMDALSYLVYVRMKMATYFSLDDLVQSKLLSGSSTAPDRDRILKATWHFGLSVPLYTHFTSPIRRYADLLVHRQLAAILNGDHLAPMSSNSKLIRQLHHFNYKTNPGIGRGRTAGALRTASTFIPSRLSLHAAWCNHQRMMTRRAQEASQRLFLTACLRDCGALEMNATVVDLTSSNIKLLLPAIGIIIDAPIKQFFQHVKKWEVFTTTAAARNKSSPVEQPAGSSHANNKRTKPVARVTVMWTPDEQQQQPPNESKPWKAGSGTSTTAAATTSTSSQLCMRELSVLSVVPCRVYCQSDRLSLHAEFLTTSATSGSAGPVESSDCFIQENQTDTPSYRTN